MPPRATPRTARGENSTALVTREAARSSVRSQPLGGPDDSPTTTEEDAEQRMTPAEQRRARHRRVVKQSYYRKLDTLKSLRAVMSQLEQQFGALVVKQTIRPGDSSCCGPVGLTPSLAYSELLRQYIQSTLHKEELIRENESLQRRADLHADCERKLQTFVREQMKIIKEETRVSIENLANGAPPESPRISIVPFTGAECLEVAAGAYREIREFLSKSAFLTSGVSAFGWRDRRKLTDGKLMFSLKKFHQGVDARGLARRGWEACAQRLRQFYPSSMDMKHYTVQTVDANNTVLYRVMLSADKRYATKALMLVSHFQTETGFAMIMRSLDQSRVLHHKREVAPSDYDSSTTSLADSSPEQWVNVFTWILFDRAGDDDRGCMMDFGGIVPRNTVVGSEVWMMEVLPIALRLESALVAPLFDVSRGTSG